MPFSATWMELETLILSEVTQKEKDKYHMISHIWNLIYSTKETFHRKENHGLGEQTFGCQGGAGGSGMDWEFGVNRCGLLPSEWISNETLLCSTGNHVQSLIMEHDNVRKRMCTCMCNWVTMLYSRRLTEHCKPAIMEKNKSHYIKN